MSLFQIYKTPTLMACIFVCAAKILTRLLYATINSISSPHPYLLQLTEGLIISLIRRVGRRETCSSVIQVSLFGVSETEECFVFCRVCRKYWRRSWALAGGTCSWHFRTNPLQLPLLVRCILEPCLMEEKWLWRFRYRAGENEELWELHNLMYCHYWIQMISKLN